MVWLIATWTQRQFWNAIRSINMKVFIVICVSLILVDLSSQYAELVNCKSDSKLIYTLAKGCLRLTCESETTVSGVPCPLYQCQPGTEIGYEEEDPSKMYPDCCGQPICRD